MTTNHCRKANLKSRTKWCGLISGKKKEGTGPPLFIMLVFILPTER